MAKSLKNQITHHVQQDYGMDPFYDDDTLDNVPSMF